MTARERRRQRLATALRHVEHTVAGKYARQNRQEWAASRRADGWSEKIVRDAISAGALAVVRAQDEMLGQLGTSSVRLLDLGR